jgi:hypothetical protein
MNKKQHSINTRRKDGIKLVTEDSSKRIRLQNLSIKYGIKYWAF